MENYGEFMKMRLFNNMEREFNDAMILEGINSGKSSYIQNPEIKEVYIDGQWVPNPGYDLQKVKSQKLSEIESKILDASMKLDKASSLNLQTQVTELTAKLTELNKQKGEINAL